MREPIVVEARFEVDGGIKVLALERHGSRHAVAATGRQWDAGDGRHFLVMTPAEKVVELLFRPRSDGLPWLLVREYRRGAEMA